MQMADRNINRKLTTNLPR